MPRPKSTRQSSNTIICFLSEAGMRCEPRSWSSRWTGHVLVDRFFRISISALEVSLIGWQFDDSPVGRQWYIKHSVIVPKGAVSVRERRISIFVTAPNASFSRNIKGFVSLRKHPVRTFNVILHHIERLFPHLLRCYNANHNVGVPHGGCRSFKASVHGCW